VVVPGGREGRPTVRVLAEERVLEFGLQPDGPSPIARSAPSASSTTSATPATSQTTQIEERTRQPPVEGVVTGSTSAVVETDRDVAGNEPNDYRYAVSADGASTYGSDQTVTFSGAEATFTVTGLSALDVGLRVRKHAAGDTGFASPLGTSTVVLARVTTGPLVSGPVVTILNASGKSRIGSMTATLVGGSGGAGSADGSGTPPPAQESGGARWEQ